jgi:hypothetical protein
VPLPAAVDALVVGAGLDREHSLPHGRHEALEIQRVPWHRIASARASRPARRGSELSARPNGAER